MKVVAGTLALSGILALLAACEYSPHDSPENIARSHDKVMETLTSDIDSTGPAPVYFHKPSCHRFALDDGPRAGTQLRGGPCGGGSLRESCGTPP